MNDSPAFSGESQHKTIPDHWQRAKIEENSLALGPGRWHTLSMNITVAISGGTDSLFALLYLKEQGHSVTALHARFLPSSGNDPVPALEKLCRSIGIPLRVADLSEAFRRSVIEPFALAHTMARTPNPCALCNRAMKFGRLLDAAAAHGETFATGHYASMEEHPVYGPALRAGKDGAKDQSYFLALVPTARLRRCIFPLSTWKKTDIRAWLAGRGHTPPLPSESQEICFIPDDDHYAWLEKKKKEGLNLPGPGPVLLAGENRIIAEHRGLWQYTEGQRRGLRIAWKEPLYVLQRRPEDNTLVVGPRNMLPVLSCSAGELNLMVEPALWPEELFVRVRYHQAPVPARVSVSGERMIVEFLSPQQLPAPGQVAAVYDGDGFVLAGGILN